MTHASGHDVRDVMDAIGDYEGDHGTPDQRYAAYEQGYQSANIESCLRKR